jgi:hypothetical protein
MGNACIRAYGDSLIKVILAGKVTRVSHKPCKCNILFTYLYIHCTVNITLYISYKNYVYDEVNNKYEYPSVTKMVQELGWLPLVTRRQVSRLVIFYRVVHGQMGWSSVPGVSRGVYHGRGDHTLKVERVGSRRNVGKYSFAKIERVGSGTLSLRKWQSWKRGGILGVLLLTATQ